MSASVSSHSPIRLITKHISPKRGLKLRIMVQSPVSLRCTQNRTHVKVNSPATLFVAIDLNASAVVSQSPARNPLNIALTIDCSGSMQEDNKFDFAQEAAVSLVKSLRPTDTISIVSFETKARVEVPLTQASDPYYLEKSIIAIPLGKETDLYEGLRLAWEQIRQAARPGVVSRVITITDGEPTHGKTKEKDFVKLAEEIGQSGIPVTTLGVGIKYNERLLMSISQATGSLWYHVSNASFMSDIFSEEVTQMSRTVMQNPILTITPHEGTEILDAYTMRPMVSKLLLPLTHPHYDFKLKDIVTGEDQTVFLRLRIPGRPAGQYSLLRAQLGPQTSELTIVSTEDEQLANVESDPYPRLLWVAGDGLTQVQHWLDGETHAKVSAETRLRTLVADPNLATVVRSNPNLDTAVTQLRQVHDEATRIAPGNMSEDDKKRLRQQTTVLKRR